MEKIDITSRFKNYAVEFVDSLSDIVVLEKQPETFFVFDCKVYNLYKKYLPDFTPDRLFLVDAEEAKKNIQTVLAICEKMTAMPSKRNTHLVSVGGGIVQDLTGFVASSLYRGIQWTFYPSTLLAACDSCIGGKSSLNYKGFKNLLGSFYPPDVIRIYPNFFHTLTPRDYCSGLGEVVKFNVIAGKGKIDRIKRDLEDILGHDYNKLEQYVKTSLMFKRKFIEQDEFDKGIRVLLNFAHTFGHALETVSDYAIPHGSAVVLGMVVANNISVQRGFLSSEYTNEIETICKKILSYVELKEEWLSIDHIINAIRKDKKQTNTEITAVLIITDASLQLFRDVRTDEIDRAIHHLRDFFISN